MCCCYIAISSYHRHSKCTKLSDRTTGRGSVKGNSNSSQNVTFAKKLYYKYMYGIKLSFSCYSCYPANKSSVSYIISTSHFVLFAELLFSDMLFLQILINFILILFLTFCSYSYIFDISL